MRGYKGSVLSMIALAFAVGQGMPRAASADVISQTNSTWTCAYSGSDLSATGYGRIGNYGQASVFVHFDVSSLTAPEVNAPGFDATLVLTEIGGAGSSDRNGVQTLDVGAVDHTWGPTDSWYSSPSLNEGNHTATVYGTATVDNGTVPSGTAVPIDVTSLIQGWVNGTVADTGLQIYDPNNSALSLIENDKSVAPYLQITQGVSTPPVPEPASLSLLAVGALALVGRRRS